MSSSNDKVKDKDKNKNDNESNLNNLLLGAFAIGAIGLVGAGIYAFRSNNTGEEEQHTKPANYQYHPSSDPQRNVRTHSPVAVQSHQSSPRNQSVPRDSYKFHTQSRTDTSVYDLTADTSRLTLKDDKPKPPFQGADGYWEDRDQFHGEKSFGFFRCKKKHTWTSAHSYPRYKQKCKKCESEVLPTYLWVNYSTHYREDVEERESKPHDTGRCGKCRELGMPCWY